ncbi:MAG TPA: hypothetical protein VE954_07415 [Oligoflexus sp.]|uniref:hypothetical protein n=1 Tax=Oligoflexus sp. TaxID=1971216 RepID=UPI002D2B6C36|nr:hypothetical protein [Oligoflexus sp.]HYX32927.1 hypothetical protein [Oligoflexus sp.]
MLRAVATLTLALTAVSCGVPSTSQLHDIGTNVDPAKRTLEVMGGFKNHENLERQFRLLSKAAGLAETLSLQLYGAIDMEGEYVEFLSTPGLKYSDVVTEGSVFKLTSIFYSGDTLEYKIGSGLPEVYQGHSFEQGEKDGVPMAISGHPGDPATAESPNQSQSTSQAKELIFLCKNIAFKHPYTEDWRKLGCDLNVVSGKLQIIYNKTPANPQGTVFAFTAPAVL